MNDLKENFTVDFDIDYKKTMKILQIIYINHILKFLN